MGQQAKRNADVVFMEFHKAFMYAKYLEPDKCLLKMVMNIDPHMAYLPQTLLNWGMKNLASVYLKYIQSRAENLPEVYKVLMEQKKDFYDKV